MKPPTRTTSLIGNSRLGFTFIEVMVTLVVLSAGIVFIYKTFFTCVDYLSRLTLRLHASELVDEKIADINRVFRETKDIAASRGSSVVTQQINHKRVDFTYQIEILPLSGYEGVFSLNVGVTWSYAGHQAAISRLAVLSL